MDKLWIFFVLLAIGFGVKAQSDEAVFPDYWSNENWYDDVEDLNLKAVDDKQSKENFQGVADIPDYNNGLNNDDNQSDDLAVDSKIQKEIDDFRSEVENSDLKDLFAKDNDYQYEDNRSDLKDEQVKYANAELSSDTDENLKQKVYAEDDGQIQDSVENSQNVDLSNLGEQSQNLDEDVELNDYESVVLPDGQPNFDQIVEETKAILKETDDLFDESKIIDDIPDIQLESNEVAHSAPLEETIALQDIVNQPSEQKSDESNDEPEETLPLQDIVNQPSDQNSEEINDEPEETIALQDIVNQPSEQNSEEINDEPEKTIALQDIVNQPSEQNSEEIIDEPEETLPLQDIVNQPSEQKSDESNDEPKKTLPLQEIVNQSSEQSSEESSDESEETFSSQNEDRISGEQGSENTINDQSDKTNASQNEGEIDEEECDMDYSVNDYEEENGRPFREGEVLRQRDYDYEQVNDANLDDLFEDLEKLANDDKIDETVNENDQQVIYPDVETIESEKSVKSGSEEISEIQDAINDGVAYEEVVKEEKDEIILPLETNEVNDTSSKDFNELMKTFAEDHKEDMDFNSPGFDRNIAPIHITLNTDEAVIVQSPNYPSPYPTNNIVDWIFDGDGMGIEFNLTDFAVNGAIGDYLLIKPGGIDETGNEGLIFSYTLDEPRMYRFLNVDRMFVRFESKIGMAFTRGFSFSIKLVQPRPELANVALPEEEEDAEPVISAPNATLTLTLGGITLQEFQVIKEQFRMIIADMATMYINTNSIDQGLYTTMEVTQITSAVMCNLNWPNFEVCSEVTFGVPLHYEQRLPEECRLTQEELQDMWNLFAYVDPFASRISRLGITDFETPNDVRVLSVWMVVLLTVLVSAAVLALVLWRYSCKGNYKRMPSFSEEGRPEKPGLDLYPTPHQTLPPLYSHSDYKWAETLDTRVDMGGFSNKSYTPDEMDELDSEDDVINQHRTQDNVRPKDVYQLV